MNPTRPFLAFLAVIVLIALAGCLHGCGLNAETIDALGRNPNALTVKSKLSVPVLGIVHDVEIVRTGPVAK